MFALRWIILGLLLAGCDSVNPPALVLTDAEVSRILVGRWSEEVTDRGTLTHEFASDGKYVGDGIVHSGGDIKITGTWQVMGGELIYTMETCRPTYYKNGDQLREKILAIDEREFKYQDIDGKTRTMIRLPRR